MTLRHTSQHTQLALLHASIQRDIADTMLILTRTDDEAVMIGEHITVTVLSSERGRVSLGFTAPQGALILREELVGDDQRNDPDPAT